MFHHKLRREKHTCATDKIIEITINLARNGAKNRPIFHITRKLTVFFFFFFLYRTLFFHRTGINNLAKRLRWLTEVACDPRMKGEHKEIGVPMTRKSNCRSWIYYQISPCINSLMDWAECRNEILEGRITTSSFWSPFFFFFFSFFISFFHFFFSRRSTLDVWTNEVSRGDFSPAG